MAEAPLSAPSRKARTFGLPASCPACEGPISLINGTSNGSLSVGIFSCDSCNREWEVTCRINPHRLPEQEAERVRRRRYARVAA